MSYIATRPMRLGERAVRPGDPAPEVATFTPQDIKRLLTLGYVIPATEVPRAIAPAPPGQRAGQR